MPEGCEALRGAGRAAGEDNARLRRLCRVLPGRLGACRLRLAFSKSLKGEVIFKNPRVRAGRCRV